MSVRVEWCSWKFPWFWLPRFSRLHEMPGYAMRWGYLYVVTGKGNA